MAFQLTQSSGDKSFTPKSSARNIFANRKLLSKLAITLFGSFALAGVRSTSHPILRFCTVSDFISPLQFSSIWLIWCFELDYRVCEFGGDDCVKTPSVEDRTAHKYSSRLVERVGAVYDYLKEPCDLPDLPPVPTKPPSKRTKVLRVGKLGSTSGNNITSSKLSEQQDVKIKKIVFP